MDDSFQTITQIPTKRLLTRSRNRTDKLGTRESVTNHNDFFENLNANIAASEIEISDAPDDNNDVIEQLSSDSDQCNHDLELNSRDQFSTESIQDSTSLDGPENNCDESINNEYTLPKPLFPDQSTKFDLEKYVKLMLSKIDAIENHAIKSDVRIDNLRGMGHTLESLAVAGVMDMTKLNELGLPIETISSLDEFESKLKTEISFRTEIVSICKSYDSLIITSFNNS